MVATLNLVFLVSQQPFSVDIDESEMVTGTLVIDNSEIPIVKYLGQLKKKKALLAKHFHEAFISGHVNDMYIHGTPNNNDNSIMISNGSFDIIDNDNAKK